MRARVDVGRIQIRPTGLDLATNALGGEVRLWTCLENRGDCLPARSTFEAPHTVRRADVHQRADAVWNQGEQELSEPSSFGELK